MLSELPIPFLWMQYHCKSLEYFILFSLDLEHFHSQRYKIRVTDPKLVKLAWKIVDFKFQAFAPSNQTCYLYMLGMR